MIRLRTAAGSMFFLAVLCGGVPHADCQTASTGQLVGDISDPSGAAIPRATVTVKETSTGETRTVTSDHVGHYVVPLLPPGTYSLTATATGFATGAANGITVPAATSTTLNLQLSVGTAEQSVTVAALAEILQTERELSARLLTSTR